MTAKLSFAGRKAQSGVMLLEALIGILIFSLGILALVGMQGLAVRLSTDARERAEASNLASQIVGEMWLNRTNLANYAYAGSGTPPTELTTWVAQVEAQLPDAAANRPVITIAPSAMVDAGTETTVTLRWKTPSDAQIHQFIMTAYIN